MFEFHIQGFIVISILFILSSAILIWKYKKLLQNKIISSRLALIFLRVVVMIILLILLIDPWVKWNNISVKNPRVALFNDVSKSINIHETLDSIKYSESINNIVEWSVKQDIELETFQFGYYIDRISTIDTIIYNANNTNYAQIMDTVRHNMYKYIFLVTDGIATDGPVIESIKIIEDIPIYTIGIGQTNLPLDIKIQSLEYDTQITQGDSLHLDLTIWANLLEPVNTFISIRNKESELAYYAPLNFTDGEGLMEYSLTIPPEKLSNQLNLSIKPISEEFNKDNNSIDFNVDIQSESEKILILSGSLSPNTGLLKSIIQDFPKADISHYFRPTRYKWIKNLQQIALEEFNLIILDDFPIYTADMAFLSKIIDKTKNIIPVIYFEGPNSVLIPSDQISNVFNLNVKNTPNENSIKLSSPNSSIYNISDTDLSNLPPLKRNHIWNRNNRNGNSILEYSDGSQAIYQINNITGIFIPEIGVTELKVEFTDNKNSIYELLSEVIELVMTPGNELIKLFVSTSSIDIGQSVQVEINFNSTVKAEIIQKELKLVAHHDTQEYPLSIKFNDQENKYYAEFIPGQFGEWVLSGEIKLNETERISVNTLPISVQKTHIEEKQLYQNITGLKKISENTNGIYTDIHNLNSLLSQLSFPKESVSEEIELSAITTYKFWWILILLFSIEWMIRKRKGLL